MNNQLSKLKSVKKEEGFTIIEVMIVLAIAGLILLIVFLAVPALQRNARNTTMKTDGAAVAAAVNEYKNNNDGAVPTAIGNVNTLYKKATTTTVGLTAVTANGNYAPALNNVTIYTNATCGTAPAYTFVSGKTAVYYSIETGTAAYTGKCIDV
jgi:prepilin-type N-terminal cleavage/methylation domain-containing protein